MSMDQDQQFQPEQNDGNAGQESSESFGYGDGTFISEERTGSSRNSLLLFGALVLTCTLAAGMYLRGGPAQVEATGETSIANETVSSFLDGGDENIRQMQRMLQDTERVVEQFLSYPSVTQVPVDDLQGNPFRFMTEQAAKSEKEDPDQERQAVLKAVQALHLQSVMHSDTSRACMINNVVYREGQQVSGFTIQTIKPGSVVVQQEKYRFELRMRQ